MPSSRKWLYLLTSLLVLVFLFWAIDILRHNAVVIKKLELNGASVQHKTVPYNRYTKSYGALWGRFEYEVAKWQIGTIDISETTSRSAASIVAKCSDLDFVVMRGLKVDHYWATEVAKASGRAIILRECLIDAKALSTLARGEFLCIIFVDTDTEFIEDVLEQGFVARDKRMKGAHSFTWSLSPDLISQFDSSDQQIVRYRRVFSE